MDSSGIVLSSPEKNSSQSLNGQRYDSVKNLLKKVWKAHLSTVRDLNSRLEIAEEKRRESKDCSRCNETESESKIRIKILEDRIQEKDGVVKYLENQIENLRNAGYRNANGCQCIAGANSSINEKPDLFSLPRILDSKLAPIVPETQDDGIRSEFSEIETQNPIVAETLDPSVAQPPENGETSVPVVSETGLNRTEADNDETFIEVTPPSSAKGRLAIKQIGPEAPASSGIKLESVDGSPLLLRDGRGFETGANDDSSDDGLLSTIKRAAKRQVVAAAACGDNESKKSKFSCSPGKRMSRQGILKQSKLSLCRKNAEDPSAEAPKIRVDSSRSSDSQLLLDEMALNTCLAKGDDLDETYLDQERNDENKRFPEGLGYKYKEVVRGKEDRQKLEGYTCYQCDQYYGDLDDEEKKKRLKKCSRHRATHSPTKSPPHYWSIQFPSSQELRQRGEMDETQEEPLKVRRKRRYELPNEKKKNDVT